MKLQVYVLKLPLMLDTLNKSVTLRLSISDNQNSLNTVNTYTVEYIFGYI